MKAKSMKLRMLVTLRVLFKHSDAEHRMNSIKLNKHLAPYGLQCTRKVLSDTVRIMRENGIDVRHKGEWDCQGVWIEDRPLNDGELDRLIFAVSTNPHITKEHATEILSALKPLVTEWQEDKLKGMVNTTPDIYVSPMLFEVFAVIREAIQSNRRVSYFTDYVKYEKVSQSAKKRTAQRTSFIPKSIYQTNGNIYMVGYNCTERRIEAINLKNITDIKLSFKHRYEPDGPTAQLINEMQPNEYIADEKEEPIYEGDIMFYCRGQYVGELYERFGAPSGSVMKDARRRVTYLVQNAKITPKTLLWLFGRDGDIVLKGPDEAIVKIKEYTNKNIESISSGYIPLSKKRKTAKRSVAV